MTSAVAGTRRIAAAIAVIALALALVGTIAILLRNAGYAILAVIALFFATVGAWWVVTERMPRRAIGAVVALGSVVVIAWSVWAAADSLGAAVARTCIIVGLLGLATVSARVALRSELRRFEVRSRDVQAPVHAVLLCNPKSGGGKVERFGIVELANELGVEPALLEPGKDLEQLARDAVDRGADCLGMAGGDGSQALVASIAIEHDLPFVCVSAGTRNHFALDLGLNRDDPRESVYAFRDAVERKVDYATVNGRLFVNNVSLGVYAQIVQEDSYRDAKVDTAASLLPEMLGRLAEPFDLQFTTPDGHDVDGAILIMVSNNPYVIGATPDNAQRRRLDSGQLGVFAVTSRTGTEAGRLIASHALGRAHRSPFWHEFTGSSFEVSSRSGRAYAGVDGEALELSTPLWFESHPRGLTLLVPRGNIDAAERRAARDVSVRDLLVIAAGREP